MLFAPKFILFIVFILSYSALSLPSCSNIQEPSLACMVVTPMIDCSTYDLYDPANSLDTNDGAMEQIGSTGIYNFSFNESTEGAWTILLCDNTTSTIDVSLSANSNLLLEVDYIEENTSAILTQLDIMNDPSGTWFSDIVDKIWAYMIGYTNPSSIGLNASQTVVSIAEQTEAGGW